MDVRFEPHNTHLEGGLDLFRKRDPHLRRLGLQRLIFHSPIINQLAAQPPGIYTVAGGRQIGKTTLLKQWMKALLTKGVAPSQIAFLTGELIDDHYALLRLIQEILDARNGRRLFYLILDEVTYVREWDKGIKFLADAGQLEDVVLVLTGSDLVVLQEARMRFPGRRGKSSVVDFHLHPLSFQSAVRLKHGEVDIEDPAGVDLLFLELDAYLIHGGFLTAMNDMAEVHAIRPSTLATYSDWIRGDLLKRGKQEGYLREVFQGISKSYGSQLSWNSLAKSLSIDHPTTVADYVELLSSMDVLFVQNAILEDKLTAAPKKAKKILFRDPFIFHAVRSWLEPQNDPFSSQIRPLLGNTEEKGKWVEAIVASHYSRIYPTYYIKGEAGEVDVAYVDAKRFWPVEVKWRSQIRPQDLKQVSKYKNARVFGQLRKSSTIDSMPFEPLPVALWKICV